MSGLLLMPCRVPSYEWVWERSTFEYMVFDGIYALTAPRFSLPAQGHHSERIEMLCGAFGVPNDDFTTQRTLIA